MIRPSQIVGTALLSLVGVLALACGPKDAASHTESKSKSESKPESKSEVAAKDIVPTKVRMFDDEKIKVGCGSCIFEMEQIEGCPWAAELEGKHYLIEGKLPTDEEHDLHAADGICNTSREAIVTGKLEGDKLIVSKMELIATPPAG